ncbi:uncharacterized protein LOC128864966 isoform X2 [Anastrepha ludens]|uniref:uncharacterized protein LOC128864966 isoform X2 n=1 Tax=Anastrepha ludens TaxID=28586 RepID=UPI0023AFA7FB|nr:uncharacterized protein LOC128864966 isoform X2 [Anastrepha ludens]
MDINADNQQAAETQDGTKDDDEDAEPVKRPPDSITIGTSLATNCSDALLNKLTEELNDDGEAENEEDTTPEEGVSLLAAYSDKVFKPFPMPLLTLEGTHTTATTTESQGSVANAASLLKHVSFEKIMEDVDIPTPSTSQVVENVREYVKQIESLMENGESLVDTSPRHMASPQPRAAQIIELPWESLSLESVKDATDISYTSKLSEDTGSFDEIERMAHDEVERIVAENLASTPVQLNEPANFQQVERENKEIAERFKQIMEMFDSFTKNLESLEMPTIQSSGENTKKTSPTMRRPLSFKRLPNTEPNVSEHADAASGSSMHSEFNLELYGDCRNESTLPAAKAAAATKSLKNEPHNTSRSSAQSQRAEAALDPMCRDIATTISGLELLDEKPLTVSYSAKPRAFAMRPHEVHSLTTIGCQTSSDFFALKMTPSVSTSFSNLHTVTKDYAQRDDDIVNALIIDSTTDAPTSSSLYVGTNSFTDHTETSGITIIQPKNKILGTSDQSSLVKIREPPTIIDLTQDSNAPHITSLVTGATGNTTCTDTPCERTYHTIHIEANSSPSSSLLRRPPLCSRLWNVITDFCAAVCLCLQRFLLFFLFLFFIAMTFIYSTKATLSVFEEVNISTANPFQI